jgi:small subunit ribosomal protein S4e
MQRTVTIDGKVRTDSTFPAGFMDVLAIERTNEHFRLFHHAPRTKETFEEITRS